MKRFEPSEYLNFPLHLERHSASLAQDNDVMVLRGMGYLFSSLIDGVRGPTCILPGAASKSIKRRAGRFPFLFDHDSGQPIGLAKVEENSRGLAFTAQLSDIPAAREKYRLAADGVLTGVSIGFTPTSDYWKTIEGVGKVRFISQLELYELSMVVFPADDAARIEMSRPAGEIDLSDEEFDGWCIDALDRLEDRAFAGYARRRGYQC